MAEPILHLAPHEMAPNRRAELDSEPFLFRALWLGVEREFIGQIIGQFPTQMIFFALADEPERGNFVNAMVFVSKAPDNPVPPIWEPRTQIPYPPQKAIQCVKLSASEGWGRLYFVDEDLKPATDQPVRWRLFLAQSGWGEWNAAPDYYDKSARFCWNENGVAARELALLPPLELLEYLRPSLLDPQSDATFARTFALLTARERHQLCCPLQRGSYSEWEQVLCLFLQSRFQLWQGQPKLRRSSWRLQIHDNNVPRSPFQAAFNARFPCFSEWMLSYFEPRLDEKLLSWCVAAKEWSKRRFTLSARVELPTHHERLEALLELREWLSDKATPEEVELLLRDD